MSQEKVFMNVLYRKNAFPDYKKYDLRRSQNMHFFFKTARPWLLFGKEKVLATSRKQAFLTLGCVLSSVLGLLQAIFG